MDCWIKELFVSSVGQHVTAGQPLLAIYSPDLDSLQANYLAALASREKASVPPSTDGSELNSRLVNSARQRLRQWDLAEPELLALERDRQLPPAAIFRSPVAGVVLATDAIRGMHVQAGHSLYRIADLSVVLVEIDIRETDAAIVTNTARAELTVDMWPSHRFQGRVLTTYPYVSERNRTTRVRLEVLNSDKKLKPGMLATVVLKGTKREGLLIPMEAVLDSGTTQVVFVAQGEGRFEPRTVTLGGRENGKALILTGLQENETVVSRAAFFLDSESRMSAALEDFAPSSKNATPAAVAPPLTFAMTVNPDPPHSGDNDIEIYLTNADGSPVTDAELDIRASMAAMPSMGMPAMRTHTRLDHITAGRYGGRMSVSMAGTWDIFATAVRQGLPPVTWRSTLLVR
jgi:RND family efflux transporter MFP subunit